MKISATRLRICAASLLVGAAFAAAPVAAQEDVTDRSVDARDVAMSPLEDFNLAKDPIPPALIKARTAPYDDWGLDTCEAIQQELGNLDAVLGEDFDTAEVEGRGITPAKVARGVLRWLMPYRSILREVTGANDHEFHFRESISAGLVRRGYLKGMGQAKDCPYPARPATPEMIAALRPPPEPEVSTAGSGVFVSEPVVQPIR